MKGRWIGCVAGLLMSATYATTPCVAVPVVVSGQRASAVVIIADLRVLNGRVSGLLVNKSPELIRDVRLLVRHAWLWNDERHPGTDDPGRAVYFTVPKDIGPGHAEHFMYAPEPPLPRRSDGRFETTVQVVGYTGVGD